MGFLLVPLLSAVVFAQEAPRPPAETRNPGVVAEEERRRSEEQERRRREQEMQRQPQSGAARFLRVEGKILMAGGGPPPDRVTVAAVCAGALVAKVATNSKGAFGMQLGRTPPALSDASIGRGGGSPSLSPGYGASLYDCELQAVLPGFRAQPHRLNQMQAGSSGLIQAVLILHRVEGVSGYTFSATSLAASKDARKAYDQGVEAFGREKYERAEAGLRRAVKLHPKYAAAWYELTRVLLKTGRAAGAREALETSVQCDPAFLSPHPLLAQLALNEKRWEDLAGHTGAVLKLHPGYSADIYLFSAQANLLLGRLELAERHALEAVRMDTQHKFPVAHRLLARVLTQRGKSREAIAALRAYAEFAAPADAEAARAEIASWEAQAPPT